MDLGPGGDERVALAVESLRVEVGADEADHDRDGALCAGRGDRRRQQGRGIRLGTVAVRSSAAAAASCSRRSVGSIIGWARPWVRASSPKSTMVWVSASSSSVRARSSLSGMLLRTGPSVSVAIIIASSQSVPPQ